VAGRRDPGPDRRHRQLLARGWWLMAVPYALVSLCLAWIILDPAMAEGVEDD
jgi:hypothetical protein